MVMSEMVRPGLSLNLERPLVTIFEDEDEFLKSVINADLFHEDTTAVVVTVLQSISQPVFPQRWIAIDVTTAQLKALGLFSHLMESDADQGYAAISPTLESPFEFTGGGHFQDFLMQVPTPILMLEGQEHLVTFINPPYVRLLGRTTSKSLLGKPIREALPELKGQPFFGLLDKVYRTGTAHVGVEVLGNLRHEDTGRTQDIYVDFIYQSVRNEVGEVFGIMVQASDATDRVLARQVSESREDQLYRQWAELDTIYRTAPVGMCLIDAADYRVLRVNNKLAHFTGQTASALVGMCILDIFPGTPGLKALFDKVRAGFSIENHELSCAVPSVPGILRHWLVNYGPMFGTDGNVEAITCVSQEITDRLLRDETFEKGETVVSRDTLQVPSMTMEPTAEVT